MFECVFVYMRVCACVGQNVWEEKNLEKIKRVEAWGPWLPDKYSRSTRHPNVAHDL